MSPSPINIEVLPIELIEELSRHIEPADLLAWRLVCRQFNVLSTKAFGKAHISIRRHAFSTRDLEKLIEIAKHPTFGSFVRHVEISAQIMQRMGLTLLVREAQREPMYAPLVGTYDTIASDQEALLRGEVFPLLHAAFKSLKEQKVSEIRLGVAHEMPDQGFTASMWKPLTQEAIDSIEPYRVLRDLNVQITRMLVKAAHGAGLKVAQLDIVEHGVLAGDVYGMDDEAYCNIRCLNVEVVERYRGHLREESVQRLAEFFSNAKAIEVLRVSQKKDRHHPESAIFPGLMESATVQPLREIELQGLFVDSQDLVKWLARFKSTLRSLSISDIELGENEPDEGNVHAHNAFNEQWTVLVQWMLDNLDLEYLHLGGLVPNPINDEKAHAEATFLDGPAVKQGLREFLSFVTNKDEY